MITATRSETVLQGLMRKALARDPQQQALEFEGRWYVWGELAQVAERVQAAVAASGMAPGSPILFAPRNRPSSVGALVGLIAAGHNVRMAYAFQGPAAIAGEIARLKPPVVIAAAEDFSPEVLAALEDGGIAGIALSEMDALAVPGHEWSRNSAQPLDGPPRIEVLTSGTTGRPKHFAVYHDMISTHLLGANAATATWRAGDETATPLLLFSPMGNIGGVYTVVPMMANGQRCIMVDRFTIRAWHDYVLRFRPTASSVVPAGVQMILDADIPKEDLASIQALGAGAAPVDPQVQREFETRYGIPLLLSYGATEFAGPVCAMTLAHRQAYGDSKIGSVGKPMPGVKLRVVDAETGAEVPSGTEGLLEVISPRIGDDWIRTQDLAVIDEDGFLFHRGRADGAIMRGGFKLLPETIENALQLHEAVAVAAVAGLPDRRLGQVPVAVVQFRKGMSAPIAELDAHLRTHVLSTHIPVQWRVVEEMPRTPSMKVDRRALLGLFKEG